MSSRTRWRDVWDAVVMAATIFAAIEIPMRISLEYPVVGPLFYVDWLTTILFSLDILLHFRRPVMVGRAEITDKRELARRYLKGWFTIDFLATIPFDLLVARTLPVGDETVRVLRLLRITRVARLLRLADLMRKAQQSHLFNAAILRLVFFLFWVLVVSHWVACGWLSMGTSGELTGADAYLRALYWTITTLTTVGYGDITPDTNAQIIFTMIVMMAGVAVYGYVIGNVATLLANIDVAKAAHQKRVESVTQFMKERELPRPLQERVLGYLSYIWESGRGQDRTDAIGGLPPSLQTEIMLHLHKEILSEVPLFKGASEGFLKELVKALRPVVYTPGDFIITRGESGAEMYFIHRGQVQVLARDEETVVVTLGEGAFFGEMSLLLRQPRTASIRAVDYCELYTIDQQTFELVLEHYPEFAKRVRAIVDERQRSTIQSMKAVTPDD